MTRKFSYKKSSPLLKELERAGKNLTWLSFQSGIAYKRLQAIFKGRLEARISEAILISSLLGIPIERWVEIKSKVVA